MHPKIQFSGVVKTFFLVVNLDFVFTTAVCGKFGFRFLPLQRTSGKFGFRFFYHCCAVVRKTKFMW